MFSLYIEAGRPEKKNRSSEKKWCRNRWKIRLLIPTTVLSIILLYTFILFLDNTYKAIIIAC